MWNGRLSGGHKPPTDDLQIQGINPESDLAGLPAQIQHLLSCKVQVMQPFAEFVKMVAASVGSVAFGLAPHLTNQFDRSTPREPRR